MCGRIMNKEYHYIVNPSVVAENETVAREAYERGDYISCFLLTHTLVESLLRAFLGRTGNERFADLIDAHKHYLKEEKHPEPVFVDELMRFNRRRNQVAHGLWKNGYAETNKKLEPSCRAAFIMFGLLIEWFETFNPKITESGFSYEG